MQLFDSTPLVAQGLPADGRALRAYMHARRSAAGLSNEQIRARLSQAGYSPALLDAYLADSTDASTPPSPSNQVREAIQVLALPEPSAAAVAAAQQAPAAQAAAQDAPRPAGPAIFGLDVFNRATTQFQPLTGGPVPGDYVIGPGDELQLIITGEVEANHSLTVSREGYVIIPRVGQVPVSGVTLDALRRLLLSRLSGFYSGLRANPPTTRFDVALGRLRTNQIFVTGEVATPGNYVVSSVASILNALYLAGGPTASGSLRDVQLMRGGKVARHVDLYDYLLRGNNLNEVRLEPGDVAFVPIHGALVTVEGSVSRPGIYELKPGETMYHLLRYAGGLTVGGSVRRARVTRILPPAERRDAGVDRVVLDANLATALADSTAAMQLREGDEVQVFQVRREVRNVVSIAGAVWQPGSYSFRPGLRVWDLIKQGNGLSPEALLNRAQIERLNLADSTLSLLSFSLDTTASGTPRENPVLQEYDEVRVFSKSSMEPSHSIEVRGAVRNPGVLNRFEGMTLSDAILRSGGLVERAYSGRAHISRLNADLSRRLISVQLRLDSASLPLNNDSLHNNDIIQVYGLGAFADSFSVSIVGEVRDGRNETFQDGMTLRDLVIRAGGLTPHADLNVEIVRVADSTERVNGRIASVQRVRLDSTYVIIQSSRPPSDAGSEFKLKAQDRVFVRRTPNSGTLRTVRVVGEVMYPGAYALESKDERLGALIRRAGGLTATAFADGFRMYRDGNLVNVELPNVLKNPRHRDNLVLQPGDSLVVPEYNPVVTIVGAVNSPSTVLYRRGASLGYYIENAGGYARGADRDHVSVRYANGAARLPTNFLMFTVARPEPGPGSVITVPTIPPSDRADLRQVFLDTIQALSAVATLALVISRI
jgi:polysaccharide export outer membrane protein